MKNEIVVTPEFGGHLSVDAVLKQQEAVQDLIKRCLKKDVHFGKITGCGDKMNLLKPGGEKLCFTFRMKPKYETEKTELHAGHREYFKICRLYTYDGVFLGEATGVCSTMEAKYRWRDSKTSTGQMVPKEYWTLKNKGDYRGARAKIGGKGFGTIKEDGTWFICKIEKIENPDIADCYNTVDKMAEKRAFLGVVRQVLAVSDIFEQGRDDEPEGDEPTEEDVKKNAMSAPKSKSDTKKEVPPASHESKKNLIGEITQPQIKAIYALFKKLMNETSEEGVRENCGSIIGIESLKSLKDLTKQQGSDIIEHLNEAVEAQKQKAGSTPQ